MQKRSRILLLVVIVLGITVLGNGFGIATKKSLTNNDIVSLVKAGLSDKIIILLIQKSEIQFDLTPDALIELKQVGVSNAVIEAMLRASTTLLVVGDSKTGSNPVKVLSKYLDASLHGRYEETYQYVSTKDKAIKTLQQYLAEQSKEESPLTEALINKISYKIKEVIVSGNKAKADVDITIPDFAVIFKDILAAGLISGFGQEKDEKEIDKMLTEKYKGEDIPMVTTAQTFDLVKEADGWKVFLDWETEKKEAEKKRKVEALLSEARQLKKQKKLYGALKKYDEVLELDSQIVEAKQDKEEILKEIKAFEEKQSYIKYIELKGFKVGKGSRFGLGEPEPAIFGKVINHGNRTLRKVKVTVYFLGKDGKPIAEEDYYPVLVTEFSFDNKPLKPGYIKEFGYVVGDKVPSEWSGKARAKISDIEFQE
ncbi:hypothetical protein J7M02_00785 [Candidatus Aerophobetes bacterium]|nr:hypothetical protein [Candidatus Aerophobetes bacterium]